MWHALDCLVSLHLVGTRLMEHAPVYKTMGLYDGNTVLTGLAVNGTDHVVVNAVIWMRGCLGMIVRWLPYISVKTHLSIIRAVTLRLF